MMLQEMIVTNADGKTSEIVESKGVKTEKSLVGQCLQSGDMYTFYAVKKVNPASSTPSPEKKAAKVKIMMPLGGKLNGLYRFPRVGEKVVVAVEGTAHYLMGYLPTAENAFSSTTDDFKEEGLVLRYKKSGKNASGKEYSEIAFRRKDTKWPTSDSSLKNETDSTYNSTKKQYYPYVDNVEISSTGDIVSEAKNFNKLDGERVLLQSKFLTSDNIDSTGTSSVKEMTVKEDTIGKGDLFLNADRRIVLKAREGFAVEVGGCTLSITPSGISIKAGKLDGAPVGEGPFDASLSLSVKGGVDMTGRSMSGDFNRGVSFSDAFGGAFDLETGMVSVNGTSVSLGAMTTLSAIDKSVVGLASLIAQIASVPLSADTENEDGSAAEASRQIKTINSLFGGVFKYPDFCKKNISYPDASNLDTAVRVVKVIYKIFDKIKNVLIKDFDALACLHYDSTKKKYCNDDRRKDCLLACTIIDATLQAIIVGMLLVSAYEGMVHQATIKLTSNAAIAFDSKDYYQASLNAEQVAAGTGGLDLSNGGGGAPAPSTTKEKVKAFAGKAFDRHAEDAVSFVMSEIGMYASFATDSLTEDTKKALGEL
ncbi:MAG: hypothetical protein J5787_05615 [Alphaproteobacteria bacterium]|nr:hypothetical protein [Alphaproteobacteria bacterium]MBO4643588.1 hypothetical protein [Alphaproteobacteria bacterium]